MLLFWLAEYDWWWCVLASTGVDTITDNRLFVLFAAAGGRWLRWWWWCDEDELVEEVEPDDEMDAINDDDDDSELDVDDEYWLSDKLDE